MLNIAVEQGLPSLPRGKESAYNARRHGRLQFNPWVGKIPWRGKWQPVPAFLLRESHGQSSLEGYSPWGHKELDIWVTEHHPNTHSWTRLDTKQGNKLFSSSIFYQVRDTQCTEMIGKDLKITVSLSLVMFIVDIFPNLCLKHKKNTTGSYWPPLKWKSKTINSQCKCTKRPWCNESPISNEHRLNCVCMLSCVCVR